MLNSLPFMENDFYKVISWESKLVTLKYLTIAVVCFVLNVKYKWSFSMLLLASVTPRLLFSVARSLFQSETTRKQERQKSQQTTI